jgi:hypothetical protein
MPSPLYRETDAVECAQALLTGRAALCPWEWLGDDFTPQDWETMMTNFALLLNFRIGIKHVPPYRATLAINAMSPPPEDEIAVALAELGNYRDHEDRPPSRQALLLAAQHVPRLVTASRVPSRLAP